MTTLNYIERESAPNPTASIIWLHGLGASGHDFEPIVPELQLPADLPIRFIFPHAPQLPVTINNGFIMPAWYDILAMDIDREVDVAQLKASADAVVELIEQEIERGIPANRIILAGFSQGGAVAYEAALSYDKPLAGLLCLSTYLATQKSLERHPANQSIPVFIAHGTHDPVVPFSLGQAANQQLTEWAYTSEFKAYPIEHNVCLEEIQDIAQWFKQQLA